MTNKKIPRPHQEEAVNAILSNKEGIINLPTGTGKTFIESLAISRMIPLAWDHVNSLSGNHVPVFVLLSPRIMLSNQLLFEVWHDLHLDSIDCQYMFVHSGRTRDQRDLTWAKSLGSIWKETLPFREINSTTSIADIKESYSRAQQEQVPLIISATYDSADRVVKSGIPIYTIFCDEAHYLVSDEFNWIAQDDTISVNKFYLTATLKTTVSDQGLGMNNKDIFNGGIIYRKTPVEMIDAGEITRPRIHLVDVAPHDSEVDQDVNAIISAFKEHRGVCNSGAKLLVVTKGSEHLNNLANHPRMLEILESMPNLSLFDISSKHKPRINGMVVDRETFLRRLQTLTDQDEAIIMHVRILAEGIDVPGITGVMPMNNMALSEFLQTLGRATRLHPKDKYRLYNGTMTTHAIDLERYVKPYAWVVLPVYGFIGKELRDTLTEMIYGLRSYGFVAEEHVFIRQSRGGVDLKPLGGINQIDTRADKYLDILLDVTHDVETEGVANDLKLESIREREKLRSMDIDDIIKRLINGRRN